MINLSNNGTITSQYGYRKDPLNGKGKNHNGIDIVLRSDNIPAVTGGTVVMSGRNDSMGNYVKIRDSVGNVQTYMHMAAPSPYHTGDKVTEGSIIGTQGNTGRSTGKHLHFQVQNKDGAFLSPTKYMDGGYDYYEGFSQTDLVTDPMKDFALGFVGKIVEFVVLLLFAILAAVFFMKAFDIKVKL